MTDHRFVNTNIYVCLSCAKGSVTLFPAVIKVIEHLLTTITLFIFIGVAKIEKMKKKKTTAIKSCLESGWDFSWKIVSQDDGALVYVRI